MPERRERRETYSLGTTAMRRHHSALNRWHQRSGLRRSRIVREVIDFALARGYTPGSVNVDQTDHPGEPNKIEDRSRPKLGVSILVRQKERLDRMHEETGHDIARIVGEMIQFAINNGYTPGSVSVSEMRADARASVERR